MDKYVLNMTSHYGLFAYKTNELEYRACPIAINRIDNIMFEANRMSVADHGDFTRSQKKYRDLISELEKQVCFFSIV